MVTHFGIEFLLISKFTNNNWNMKIARDFCFPSLLNLEFWSIGFGDNILPISDGIANFATDLAPSMGSY